MQLLLAGLANREFTEPPARNSPHFCCSPLHTWRSCLSLLYSHCDAFSFNYNNSGNPGAKEHEDQFTKDTISTLSRVLCRSQKNYPSLFDESAGKLISPRALGVWKLLRSVINSIWFLDRGCCESSFLVVKQLKLSLGNWMSFQINLDDVWGWGMFTGWRHVHYLLLTTDCKLSKLGQGCNAATDQFAVSFMCGKRRHSTNRILSPEEYDNSICTCQ